MVNAGLIKSKYGEDAKKKFLIIQDILSVESEDKKTFAKSKDIAKMLVELKLDFDSVCAGLIYPFILKK